MVVPEDVIDEGLDIYVRAYVLYIIGCVVCPTIDPSKISSMFLGVVRNIDEIKDYAWGAAFLGYSLNQIRLFKAAGNATVTAAAVPFFIIFLFEYVENIALASLRKDLPLTPPQEFPLIVSWANLLSKYTRNNHNKVDLDQYEVMLQENQIILRPFDRLGPDFLPVHLQAQMDVAYTHTLLICFEQMAVHMPHVCAEKMGLNVDDIVQLPPLPPIIKLLRTYPNKPDWSVKCAQQVAAWNERRLHYIRHPKKISELGIAPIHEVGEDGANAHVDLNVHHEDAHDEHDDCILHEGHEHTSDGAPAPVTTPGETPTKRLKRHHPSGSSKATTQGASNPKKEVKQNTSKSAKTKQEVPKQLKRQTRGSTKLVSKFFNKPNEPLVIEYNDEDEDEAPPVTPNAPETPLAIPPLNEVPKPSDIPPAVQSDVSDASNPIPKDRASRKAGMLRSRTSRKATLDLSFVETTSSNDTPHVTSFPTDAAVSLAKITIRQFLGLDPLSLNDSERVAMLSALSVLQATPGFSYSPTGQALGSLSSLFTTCYAIAQASLDLTSKVQAFKKEKADIDSLAAERDKQSHDLALLDENYEATENLLDKVKAEVIQHEATLTDLLEKSEALEASVAKLDHEFYDRGTKLAAQKEEFQHWTSTLQELEHQRTECYAKWNELCCLDLD